MFLSARQVPAGTAIEAELCIIGAGAAGITLALALRDAGFRVLVLESGGFELDEATQALYAGENRGVPNIEPDISRLRFFGGTTNHWGGWCRPLDPQDFAPADGGALRTWPLRRADLDPYYRKAQALCQLGPFDYDDLAPWMRAGGFTALPFDPAKLNPMLFQISPPTQFGAVYREPLAKAANVTVYLHANVLELQTDATAGRVTGLRVRSLEGPEFAVTARLVVLATGALENARLLLLSDRVQAAGLGNGHDVVGRYYMDQVLLQQAGFVVFATPPADLRFFMDSHKLLETNVFGVLVPADTAGCSRARVHLLASRRVVEGIDSLKAIGSALGSAQLPEHFWYHLGRVLADYDALADAAYKTVFRTKKGLFGVPDPGNGPVVGAWIDVNAEQVPDHDSRVILTDTRDALGQRRLALVWRPGAVERRTVRRTLDLVAQEFGRLGIGRVRIKPLPDDGWPFELQGSRHPSGTTRMSDDPRTGVVDASCRVHGVANLYVAGSSVFPNTGYANPTLTIVALALRLADELKRQLA